MKRSSDKERRRRILGVVYDESMYAQSTNPKKDWKQSHDAVCKIFQMIHVVLVPKCRKNHPEWTKELDSAMREK